MTSVGHRTVPWRRPAGVGTHRTGTGRFLFKLFIVRFQRCPTGHRTVPGRTSYDVWQAPRTLQKSLNKAADARPGTGRCFMSRTATGEKRRVFAEVHTLLKTQNINTKIYISLEQLRMINMQQQVLLIFLRSWASVVSITITVRVSLNLFHFNNLFLWRNDGKFWYKWIHHCIWKIA